MHNPPLMSVIIPTYNRGDTLVSAVQSVLKQTHRDFEIIVVDDCSINPAADSLTSAGISDDRLRVVRQKQNRGQAAARNTGARHAKGHWLVFLDDDDFFYPKKLYQQLNYMIKERLRVSTTDFTLPGDRHLYNMRNSEQDPTWLVLTGRFLSLPSTMMIEKVLYNEMGGFDDSPQIRRTEDLDFALRLHLKGHNPVVMREFLSHYSGFHSAAPAYELNALEGVIQKHQATFSRTNPASRMFHVAMKWKKAHARLTGRPTLERLIKLSPLAIRYPVHVARLASSILSNPLSHLSPPFDRPRTGIPFDKKVSFPYVPP